MCLELPVILMSLRMLKFLAKAFCRSSQRGGSKSLPVAGNEELRRSSEDFHIVDGRNLPSDDYSSYGTCNNGSKSKSGRNRANSNTDENESRNIGQSKPGNTSRARRNNQYRPISPSKQYEHHSNPSAMYVGNYDNYNKHSAGSGRGRGGRGRGGRGGHKQTQQPTHSSPKFKPKSQIRAEEKYEYFWTAKDIYSQWYPSDFRIGEHTYCCAEQYMMSRKAAIFEDWDSHAKIMSTSSPREMKRLGRAVRGMRQSTWKQNAIRIVREGNIAKFKQNKHLHEKLINTYPRVLAEASPYDRVWGIGLERGWEAAWDERRWKGLNLLGYILTDVRNKLMLDLGNFTASDLEHCKVDMISLQAKFNGANIDPAQEEKELSNDEAWQSDAGDQASGGEDQGPPDRRSHNDDRGSQNYERRSSNTDGRSYNTDGRSHNDGHQWSDENQGRNISNGQRSETDVEGSAVGASGKFVEHDSDSGRSTENGDSQTVQANENSASGGNYSSSTGNGTDKQGGNLRVVTLEEEDNSEIQKPKMV